MDIWNDIKKTYQSGGILIQLIIINVAVFFTVNFIDILVLVITSSASGFPFSIVNWLAVPSDLLSLLLKPWTLVTYMFLHKDFMHILFNMLWLYWFGKLFVYFIGNKQMLAVYVYGGLAGALAFIIIINVFPLFGAFQGLPMLGASAAVMAVVMAVAFYQPDYKINLMFIGPVKLQYVAIITIALDLMYVFSSNAGGHIAHLGGAILGYFYIKNYRKGVDWSKGFNIAMQKIISFVKPATKMKVVYKKGSAPASDLEWNKHKRDDEAKLDRILDKISKHGYGSLTVEEKEFLFKQGKK